MDNNSRLDRLKTVGVASTFTPSTLIKTSTNKNITVSDWNDLVIDVETLKSDVKTIAEDVIDFASGTVPEEYLAQDASEAVATRLISQKAVHDAVKTLQEQITNIEGVDEDQATALDALNDTLDALSTDLSELTDEHSLTVQTLQQVSDKLDSVENIAYGAQDSADSNYLAIVDLGLKVDSEIARVEASIPKLNGYVEIPTQIHLGIPIDTSSEPYYEDILMSATIPGCGKYSITSYGYGYGGCSAPQAMYVYIPSVYAEFENSGMPIPPSNRPVDAIVNIGTGTFPFTALWDYGHNSVRLTFPAGQTVRVLLEVSLVESPYYTTDPHYRLLKSVKIY